MTSGPFDIADRVVVLTGGLGLLGRQFTRALLEQGAKVAVFDLRAGDASASVASGEAVLAADVDVTSKASIEAGLGMVTARWGVPHALINSAAVDFPPGAPGTGPFETYPEAAWDAVMDVNVKGVYLCCQVIGSQMAAAGRGSIINIGSTLGMVSPDQRIYEYLREEGRPFVKPVTYAVSKSALLNLTRYLATYWAPRNVRVNTLTFGGVFNNHDPRFVQAYAARVPLGRMAREDEYNAAVIFLIADASSYMTGSNLVIDGGWTAW